MKAGTETGSKSGMKSGMKSGIETGEKAGTETGMNEKTGTGTGTRPGTKTNVPQGAVKRNYAKELDQIIARLEQESAHTKSVLLHSCCAPCSSYVMEYLREYFDLTVFYYNPNITEDAEYKKRVVEQKRLIGEYNRQVETHCPEGMHSTAAARRIKVIEGDYEPACFFETVKGLEQCPEGGERCFRCYRLRLEKTAQLAAREKFDYFTTTLTISPLKNAQKLNEIGEELAGKYGVAFLPSDFKKKDGYKRSVELSAQFGLYRQDYCGCVYSRKNGQAHLPSV